MGKGTETESFCAVGKSHTDITENTEILGFKFQDSSFRSRRKRRERRTLMVDFPLRAVELNLHDSGFKVQG